MLFFTSFYPPINHAGKTAALVIYGSTTDHPKMYLKIQWLKRTSKYSLTQF